MIWMGIALRCLLLLFNFVMFRYVLGYEIREKACWPLVALTAAAAVLLPVCFPDWFSVITITPILLYLVLFFLFRQLTIGIVLTYDVLKASLYNFFVGIITVTLGFNIDITEEWYRATLLCNLLILIFYILLVVLLRKKRKEIHKIVLSIPFWLYLIFAIILAFPDFEYYSTAKEDTLKVEGILTFFDGLTGMALATIIALGVWLYFQRKELRIQIELNERCMEEQTGQYRLLYEKQQELRRFRHDSNAHLNAIAALAESVGDGRVLAYVSKLQKQQVAMKHLSTGNLIGDAIVNAYYGRGLKEGVDIELMGQFAEDFTASDTDLCVVLTNVIANAYEAASQCKQNRKIRISFSNYRQDQFLCVQNPSIQKPVIEAGIIKLGQTTKSDKENHGLGIHNILEAVQRIGGQIQWKTDEQAGQLLVITEMEFPLHPDNV